MLGFSERLGNLLVQRVCQCHSIGIIATPKDILFRSTISQTNEYMKALVRTVEVKPRMWIHEFSQTDLLISIKLDSIGQFNREARCSVSGVSF